jgi:hypothetical protein
LLLFVQVQKQVHPSPGQWRGDEGGVVVAQALGDKVKRSIEAGL